MVTEETQETEEQQDMYFNSDEEKAVNFDVLPQGWYRAVVDSIEECDTQDGEGKYVKVEMQVVEEPHQGRKLFFNFNIKNKSEKATLIGRGQFKLFATAGEVPILRTVDDLQNFIGRDMVVKIKIRKDKTGQYNDQNDFMDAKSAEAYDEYLKNPRAAPAGRSGTGKVAAPKDVPI